MIQVYLNPAGLATRWLHQTSAPMVPGGTTPTADDASRLDRFFDSLRLTQGHRETVVEAGITEFTDLAGVSVDELVDGGVEKPVARQVVARYTTGTYAAAAHTNG